MHGARPWGLLLCIPQVAAGGPGRGVAALTVPFLRHLKDQAKVCKESVKERCSSAHVGSGNAEPLLAGSGNASHMSPL